MFAARLCVFAHDGQTGSCPDCGQPEPGLNRFFRLGVRKTRWHHCYGIVLWRRRERRRRRAVKSISVFAYIHTDHLKYSVRHCCWTGVLLRCCSEGIYDVWRGLKATLSHFFTIEISASESCWWCSLVIRWMVSLSQQLCRSITCFCTM